MAYNLLLDKRINEHWEICSYFIAEYCQGCWQKSMATAVSVRNIVGNVGQLRDTRLFFSLELRVMSSGT
jgi:hypothetical protein